MQFNTKPTKIKYKERKEYNFIRAVVILKERFTYEFI
jgi:hypothetical protein